LPGYIKAYIFIVDKKDKDMNILETLKETDLATLKNIGTVISLVVGFIIVGAGAMKAAWSIAMKAVRGVSEVFKGLFYSSMILGVGYLTAINIYSTEEIAFICDFYNKVVDVVRF